MYGKKLSLNIPRIQKLNLIVLNKKFHAIYQTLAQEN